MNLKKFAAVLAVLPLLLLGACGKTAAVEKVVVKAGSCADIMGDSTCSDREELLRLRTQVEDGQKAIPDTVAQQIASHKQLIDAAAKFELERQRLELALRSLASTAKPERCINMTGNPKALAICQALQ